MRPLMNRPSMNRPQTDIDISEAADIAVQECLSVIDRLQRENESLNEQVETLAGFRRLAYRDDLTQLHNRRYFDERVREEWSRAARYTDELALILIDLDDFKMINDTAGHAAGDAVLQLVGAVMLESCRDCDITCRLGGDEFAFLLPKTDHDGANRLIARLEEAIAEREDALGLPKGLAVKLSFGVATRDMAESTSGLYQAADEAMYARKRQRKSAA